MKQNSGSGNEKIGWNKKRVKTFPIFVSTEHRAELENRIWQQRRKKNNGHLCFTKRMAKQNKFSMNFHSKKRLRSWSGYRLMFINFIRLYVHSKIDVSTSSKKRLEKPWAMSMKAEKRMKKKKIIETKEEIYAFAKHCANQSPHPHIPLTVTQIDRWNNVIYFSKRRRHRCILVVALPFSSCLALQRFFFFLLWTFEIFYLIWSFENVMWHIQVFFFLVK